MAALWRAAAFVAGVCLLQNQAALPPLAPSLWAAVLLLAAIAFRALRLPQGKIATIGAFGLAVLLCFAVGLSWANWRAHDRLRPLLPTDLRWQDIVVEGRVDGLATIDRNAARFDFAIDKLVSPPRPLPAFKARISYRPHAGAIRLGEIRDGARLRLKVRIREPRSNFNPNGFDYAGWLFARKIRYGGYTRSGEENRLLAKRAAACANRCGRESPPRFRGRPRARLSPRSPSAIDRGCRIRNGNRCGARAWCIWSASPPSISASFSASLFCCAVWRCCFCGDIFSSSKGKPSLAWSRSRRLAATRRWRDSKSRRNAP